MEIPFPFFVFFVFAFKLALSPPFLVLENKHDFLKNLMSHAKNVFLNQPTQVEGCMYYEFVLIKNYNIGVIFE